MRKTRHKEVKLVIQDLKVSEWQNHHLNLGLSGSSFKTSKVNFFLKFGHIS